MPSYTDVFGGANIYPSEISYSAIALSGDITLSWPEETSTNTNLATRIIDVTPASSGHTIILPDAKKSGTGNTILFNNKGSDSFTVANAGGVAVSGLEMSQNSMRLTWTRDEVDIKLQSIMKQIHDNCLVHGQSTGKVDYVKGATIYGFIKVANALMAFGI